MVVANLLRYNKPKPCIFNTLFMTEHFMSLTDNNFFALFGLPVAFAIDKSALKHALLEQQKRHHPDTAQDTALAQKNASLLNHAFDVLYHDDSRAVYLLSLVHQPLDNSQSINDWDFLDEMMDIRIRLDDSQTQEDLLILQDLVASHQHHHAKYFESSYQQQDWQTAKAHAQKLQFLQKLQQDIAHKLEQTLMTYTHDDDLYV